MRSPRDPHQLTQDWAKFRLGPPREGMPLFHRTAQTFADHLFLTRLYLEGHLTSTLNAVDAVYPETGAILSQLLDLNSGGFLTLSSQPGLGGDRKRQRPYVEGVVLREGTRGVVEKLGALCGRDVMVCVREFEGGSGRTVVSNVEVEDGPWPVTAVRSEDGWVDCTFVDWGQPLDEMEQFFWPRQLEGELLQVKLASPSWVDESFFDHLRQVFDVPFPYKNVT
ncbi:hypothetical protein BDK51DRAFT_42644 [Blyttiomyces helicus]|uniref:DUF6919 domain-containing protein n=1 Tax=Blyttiomyces helicus TaxID=388810 RepID=A0A4P9VXY2_9FUNG|nr:hypothetical protein BDK51DRAFT_42644 [Blyttiomyces helicus]|eukprot:RKO84604.1 hypothetical protein BDK51DRAFT_42644 [Blyttiomyces helicus]